jgi:GNAT superfamily N-acetyltransferase
VAFSVRTLQVEEVYELRRDVLRGGAADAAVHYDTDDEPTTWHLGAVDDGGRVVATSTFFPQPCPRPEIGASDQGAFRLRSMAVDPGWQGTGVGRAVLHAALDRLEADGVTVLWANARDSALGFYRRCGFDVVGPSFIDGDSGLPHTVVVRRLGTGRVRP